MKTLVALAAAAVAAATCTYTCWDVANPALDRFAACTGGTLAPPAPWTGTFVEEDCTDCGYATDRVKGYWPADGATNWAWVAKADLSNPRACNVEEEDAAYVASRAPHNATAAAAADSGLGLVGCPAPGMYHPNQTAITVRGGVNDDGCADHHFLGWLTADQTFAVKGPCPGDPGGYCFWVYGYAYGDINSVCSAEADELRPA